MRDTVGNQALQYILCHGLHGLKTKGEGERKAVIVNRSTVRQAGHDDYILQPLCDSARHFCGNKIIRPKGAMPAMAFAGAKRHNCDNILPVLQQLLYLQCGKFV